MATPHQGRPRNASADRAILEATLSLLAEQGYAGLQLIDVATRAGVSTATLYRRWSSKVPLVLAALQNVILTIELPDTGDTRQDLIAFVTERMTTAGSAFLARILPALTAEGQRNPALAEQFRSLQAPVRQQAFSLFTRGIERGDLPATLDRELALDLLIGPITFRQVFSGASFPAEMASHLVDAVLFGIASQK